MLFLSNECLNSFSTEFISITPLHFYFICVHIMWFAVIFFQPSSIDLLGLQAKLFVNIYLGSTPEKRNKNLVFLGLCDQI